MTLSHSLLTLSFFSSPLSKSTCINSSLSSHFLLLPTLLSSLPPQRWPIYAPYSQFCIFFPASLSIQIISPELSTGSTLLCLAKVHFIYVVLQLYSNDTHKRSHSYIGNTDVKAVQLHQAKFCSHFTRTKKKWHTIYTVIYCIYTAHRDKPKLDLTS